MADCFVKFSFFPVRKSLVYSYGSSSTIGDVKRWLQTVTALPQVLVDNCYVTCHGHILNNDNVIENGCHYHFQPRLVGGKGGFGSMLRAIGAQIEKTTNREACRDLSGRRMRDINNEKQLKEWMSRQVEREKERARRREERSQRLREVPKHKFEDQVYQKQKEKVSRDLDDAITAGLKRNGDASCSTENGQMSTVKKQKLESKSFEKNWNWIGINKNTLSDSDLSDDNEVVTACPSLDPTMATTSASSSSYTSMDDCTDSNSSLGSARFFSVPPPPLYEQETDPASSPDSSNNSTTSDNKTGIASTTSDNKTGIPSTTSDNKTGIPSSTASSSETVISSTVLTDATVTTTTQASKEESPSNNNNTEESSQENGAVLNVEEILTNAESAVDVEVLGLDILKTALQDRGMKCGGTLTERAQRLFAVKGLTTDQIDPSLLAKGKKNKRNKN